MMTTTKTVRGGERSDFNAMAGYNTKTHLWTGKGWACGGEKRNTRRMGINTVDTRAELEALSTAGHEGACKACLAAKAKTEARVAKNKATEAERAAKELARDIKRDGPCAARCGRAASYYCPVKLCNECSRHHRPARA